MENSDDQKGWHLKREIQLGHIVTTITVAASAMAYINRIEQRVTVVETSITAQREREAAITRQLEHIDEKLDRLIERRTSSVR